jgi:hypothetical protein
MERILERGLKRILIPFPLKLLISLKIMSGVLQHLLRELGEIERLIVEVEVRGVERVGALEQILLVLVEKSEGLLTTLIVGEIQDLLHRLLCQ